MSPSFGARFALPFDRVSSTLPLYVTRSMVSGSDLSKHPTVGRPRNDFHPRQSEILVSNHDPISTRSSSFPYLPILTINTKPIEPRKAKQNPRIQGTCETPTHFSMSTLTRTSPNSFIHRPIPILHPPSQILTSQHPRSHVNESRPEKIEKI